MAKKPSNGNVLAKNNFNLEKITGLNPRQDQVLYASDDNHHQVLSGCAGTGKTFLASYVGLKALQKGTHDKVVYIRSAVSTRNIGFLPGDDKDKSKIYETPYRDIISELLDNGSAYETLKARKAIEFMTTSFVRGITLRNSFVIVDECQNMTFHELDSLITRVGPDTTIYFCGDFHQSDLPVKETGIIKFFRILEKTGEFVFTEFEVDDIVRSGLVKIYLETKHHYEKSCSKQSNLSDC